VRTWGVLLFNLEMERCILPEELTVSGFDAEVIFVTDPLHADPLFCDHLRCDGAPLGHPGDYGLAEASPAPLATTPGASRSVRSGSAAR